MPELRPVVASLLTPRIARRDAWRWALRVALLALAYWLFGHIGPAVSQPGTDATLLWPPAGMALAALLRWGLNVWPGIAIGAWLVAPSVGLLAGPGSAGTSHGLALLLAAGCTLGPVLAAKALRREGLHLELDRRRDLWVYGAIGVLAAPSINALNGTFWLATAGWIGWAEWPSTWAHWWVGDAMGAVVVGIPLLTFSRNALAHAYGQWRWIPSSVLTLSVLIAAALAFVLADHALVTRWPLVFVPHLLLCWLAARSGLFAASATALLLTLLALLATAAGIGPFLAPQSGHGMGLLAAYVCSLLVIPLLTTALTGELAANERRWHLALDSSAIGVGDWDLVSGRVEFSARWLAMLGYPSQEFGHTQDAFWALLHPEDVPGVQRAFAPLRERRTASDTVNCRAECRMRCRDGHWHWFELHAIVAERDASGEPLRIVNTARDIADLQAARERQHVAESLFEHLHEGLLITDAQNRIVEANPAFTQITGYGRDEVLGTVPSLWRNAEAGSDHAEQRSAMQASLDTTGAWRGELVEQRRDGDVCVLQLSVSRVRNPNGSVRSHVIAIADITHAREQLEQLQRQAHFDELTRLPNRARLAQMLTDAMQTSRREGSLLTVCYLDLDHFKPVNDRYGHEAGDRLLIELANRMRRSLRSWAGGDDVVARIGGDEFVLLLRTATLDESRHAVERVLHQICQPYALGAGTAPTLITASIGATVFPLDGADAETLLRHADHAMYGAKQAGRNGYLFFDAEHDRRAEARFVALGRVQEALDHHEFRLFFQPKVDMRTAKVLGVEALLRWRHPEQGVISPAQFLPLIENTGLSVSVGNWVLQEGIDQLAQWLRDGLDITLSVNVSARHLQEPLFAQHLAGLLSRHQAPVAQHLILEVLETAALADVDYTIELMEQCRELGVRFALDDFGTGYSTFTYLKRLPLDMLKIDRSFVINMLSDRHDLAIVEGVIGLSQTFGCSVVAEGVETPEQARRLIEIGCDVGQGNGIAAAMPVDHVLDWVRDYRGIDAPRAPSTGLVTPAVDSLAH